DARRQVATASLLADAHGWRARQRWVQTEFNLDSTSRASLESAPRQPSTMLATSIDAHHGYSRRLRALQEVNVAAATVLDPDELARITLDEIVRIFGAERAFLFLADDVSGQLHPHLGRDGQRGDLERLTGYGASLVERVHESGEPLVVTGSDHGAALGSHSTVVHGLRSIMVAPLLLKGRPVGVVYLDSRAAKGIFLAEDVELLTAITTHVALFLETARTAQLKVAVQVARHERDVAELLRSRMRTMTASLDASEVAYRLAAAVAEFLPDTAAYLLHRAEDGTSALVCSGPAEAEGSRWRPLDPHGWDVPASLMQAESAVLGVRGVDPLPLPEYLPESTASWLTVPLSARGTGRGILVAATSGRPYTEAEVEVTTALAGQGIIALDNALLFERVENAATHDELTGLFNRRHFLDQGRRHLVHAAGPDAQVAAVMVDIDHFKQVNDTYGHDVGDEVIRSIAQRLASVLRRSDLIGRYGGEEFAVLLPETTPDDALSAARRLHTAVAQEPLATTAGALSLTVSVGLSALGGAGSALADLLRLADQALYTAKRTGRDRVATAHDDG
ncbi:MAG: diguanylate cyclase, partial [Dactylosporangium sp.]|nr:diguanylate cyclase [Dactylosporangium sp.]NNJ61489.1 diguanylate cyclase [Dactylosporangium sp.]